MTRRTRSAILYVLVALFFILGAAAVFYAQGWRARLSPLAFDKVGAIYLRTYPDDAEVFLDNEPKERNPGIFERGVLLGNIFPGRHTVETRKEGFKTWKASFEVAPSRVTSHPRVVLVPDRSAAATTTPVRNFAVFGEAIALETSSTVVMQDGALLSGQRIIAGSGDGRYIVTGTATSSVYFWHDVLSGASSSLAATFPTLALPPPPRGGRATSTAIEAIPDTDLFLVATAASLRVLDASSRTVLAVTATSTATITTYAASPTRIAWSEFDAAKKTSRISWYDLPTNTTFRDIDTVPGKTKRITFADRTTLLLLEEDGAFHSLSLSGGERAKIASGVTGFELASDGSRVAFSDHEGITVLAGQNGESYRFIAIDGAKDITKIAWYKDGSHLFIAKREELFFLDLADSIDLSLIAVAATPRFEYLPGTNEFYFVSGGELRRMEFPE